MIVENLEKYPDKIEHSGDLTINCSIPANYAIKVTDGQLIINGDVGEKASIYVEVEPMTIINGVVVSGKNVINSFNGVVADRGSIIGNNSYANWGGNIVCTGSSGSIINTGNVISAHSGNVNNYGNWGGSNQTFISSGGGSVTFNGNTYTQPKQLIKINGNVLDGAIIKSNLCSIECEDIADNVTISTCNSSVSVGNVGNNVRIFTSNAGIDANNIGNNCNFTTKNASIDIEKTLDNCTITTSNAGIDVQQLGNNCSLNTKNANVSVKNIGKNNNIYTTNGNIKTNNIDNKDNTFYTTNGNIKKCR